MMPAWITRIQASVAQLAARFLDRVDEHAKRDREGWGARMEYRRRYTNPDDAKRARTPPAQKN